MRVDVGCGNRGHDRGQAAIVVVIVGAVLI